MRIGRNLYFDIGYYIKKHFVVRYHRKVIKNASPLCVLPLRIRITNGKNAVLKLSLVLFFKYLIVIPRRWESHGNFAQR